MQDAFPYPVRERRLLLHLCGVTIIAESSGPTTSSRMTGAPATLTGLEGLSLGHLDDSTNVVIRVVHVEAESPEFLLHLRRANLDLRIELLRSHTPPGLRIVNMTLDAPA